MASPPKSKRVYRNPISDLPDQLLFFLLFIFGSASILLLKISGFSQLVTTLVPISLLAFYGVVAVLTKRYRLREDRVGDNIYYLGFLFTLVSLAYALYSYNIDGSGIEQIITNFGIAISTTIVGLAGRVLFAQMRVDPIEYERKARYSLAEAINSMRSQLGDISSEASIFKRKLFQIIEEGVTDSAQEARSSLEKNVAQFGDTSNAVIAKIDDAFAQFSEHSARLNEIAAESVRVLEALLERVDKIDVSPEVLQKKFDPIVEAFRTAAEETTKRNRSQAVALKRIQEFIEASQTSAATLQQTAEQTHGAIARVLSDATAKIEDIGVAAELMTRSFGEAREAIAGVADQNGERTGGLATVLQHETNVATAVFDTLRLSVESHRSAVEAAGQAIKSDLESATRHREEMEAILVESRQSLQELERSLVSLTNLLVEQVGAR